ncbi:leucine-rich repeat-containing protein 1-like isoform X2 [Bacillus rossius redtenbacheri]|uniref:leucine-rich repeat-containing protein 1-like isoform X2 n=1 Tax=Bacillus rossius redtenbacheri TaxID=93214 RepID=UPI002FDDDCF6
MGSGVAREIRQARVLHWSYVGLEDIPERLRTEGEQPPWLGSLSNLTNLYLHGNELTALPEELGELQLLSWLDVDSNQLSSLPCSLWQLRHLAALVVSNNRLSELPPDVGRLSALEYLDMSHNALRELPDALGRCRRLHELTVDGNPLVTLPGSLTGLPSLRVLTAMDCHLTHLPALQFTSRPMLRLDHNTALTYLPAHVLQHTRDVHYIRHAEYYILAAKKLLTEPVDCTRSTGLVLRAGQRTLAMPSALWHVHRPHARLVVSLYELALRASHPVAARHVASLLPTSLREELRRGPTAHCSRHECHAPIYHYATLWAVEEPHIIAALFFCSHRCCTACREPCEASLVSVDWS